MPEPVTVVPAVSPVIAPVVPATVPAVTPPEAPVVSPTQDEQLLALFPDLITRDGDEFVFTPKSVVGSDGQMHQPTTVGYRGKSVKEVLQKINDGIAEKDSTISRLQTEKLRSTVSRTPAAAVAAPVVEREVPVETDPRKAYQDIRRETFQSVVSEVGIDPKYVTYTDQQWLELEREIGAVNAIGLRNKAERVITEYERKTDARWQQHQVSLTNTTLINEVTDEILNLVTQKMPSMDENMFAQLFEQATEDAEVVAKDGRYRPERIYRNFERLLNEKLKTVPAAAPTKIQQIITADRIPLPPGVRTEVPSIAPASTPALARYKNVFEAGEVVKRELELQRK